MRNLIKKILKEEISTETKLKNLTRKYGWKKASLAVGGLKNLVKIGFDDDVQSFLNLYNNLENLETENGLKYLDNDGKTLIYLSKGERTVYVDYDKIWSFVEKGFTQNHWHSKQAVYEWLSREYNINKTVMYAHWLKNI
jgi:hypothetical protein